MPSWKSLSAVVVAVALALATMLLSACGLMRGSDYPSRDITFIIPYAPGGSADPTGRILAQESEKVLKSKLVVVNKPGASASLGTAEVVQSKPDGYTLGLGGTVANVTSALTMETPYAGPEDYTPIANLTRLGSVLVVRADSPWKTFDDLVNDARKRPGEIRLSIAAKGDQDDAWIGQFNKLYDVRFVAVPFSSGGAEALTALLGGHIDATTSKAPQARPQVEAGQLRALAILHGKSRNPALPQVPTVAELGYDKITVPLTTYFAFGPKGMDKAVVDKLAKTFIEVVKGPVYQKLCTDNGFIADPLGPTELTADIKDQWRIYSGLFKDMGIKTVR